MLAINLEPELERYLNEQAARSGQPVEQLVRDAIIAMLEDLEDIAAAEEALRNYDPSTNVSLAEVKHRLGLGD
jgi:predicted DNA-binding protein